MKKFLPLFLLMLPLLATSQKKVYNVQHYCIDQKPLAKGDCDISGNEYSFVFMDEAKKEVTLFLTSMKMPFTILSSNQSEVDPSFRVFAISDPRGTYEMRLNKTGTKIEFHLPENRIYLTVGASTKALR